MSHIALPQQPVDHDYDLPVSIEDALKPNNNNYNFGVQQAGFNPCSLHYFLLLMF
jgi:hypothetical protein